MASGNLPEATLFANGASMIMKKVDYCIIAFMLFMAFSFGLTTTEQTGLNLNQDIIGSDGLPFILLICAVLCCGWMVGCSLYGQRKDPQAAATEPQVKYEKEAVKRALVFAVGITVFITAFAYVGFCVSSFLFLSLMTLYLEEGAKNRILGCCLYALIITSICQYGFKFLNILTPNGFLF